MGHVADDAEDDESGEEGRQNVARGDDEGVAEAVVVELVVAGQRDEATPTRRQREEDLHRRVAPNFSVGE